MEKSQEVSMMSVEEYLRFEETAPIRHEYVDGEIFEMTGGTLAHNTICLNIATLLRSQLKGSPCRAYMEAIKVRIDSVNSFYYPDVLVDCSTYEKNNVYTKTPILIFEILSRSTAGTDRREKMMAYKRIPSLKTYVLVHQARRSAEVFRRDGDTWTIQILGATDDLKIDVGSEHPIIITMNEIYNDVDPENSPALQVQEDVEEYIYRT